MNYYCLVYFCLYWNVFRPGSEVDARIDALSLTCERYMVPRVTSKAYVFAFSINLEDIHFSSTNKVQFETDSQHNSTLALTTDKF